MFICRNGSCDLSKYTYPIYPITIYVHLGGMLELSEAIRDYHDHIGLPHMVSYDLAQFLSGNLLCS